MYFGTAIVNSGTTNTAPGLGLAIAAVLLAAVHLVLFSREHCACCGAPPAGAAQPVMGMPTVTNNALKAPQVQVHVQGAPALPPNWVRCGPEAGTGEYWYGACQGAGGGGGARARARAVDPSIAPRWALPSCSRPPPLLPPRAENTVTNKTQWEVPTQ